MIKPQLVMYVLALLVIVLQSYVLNKLSLTQNEGFVVVLLTITYGFFLSLFQDYKERYK